MVRANRLLISAGFWIRPKSSWYMETERQMTMTVSVPKIASLFDFHVLPSSSESKNADISPGCICGGDWIRCRGAQLRSGCHLLRKTLAFLKLLGLWSIPLWLYLALPFFRDLPVGILRWLDKIAVWNWGIVGVVMYCVKLWSVYCFYPCHCPPFHSCFTSIVLQHTHLKDQRISDIMWTQTYLTGTGQHRSP